MKRFVHVPPQWPTHTPCKIAFIGEAPSYEECDKGVPLVGPSGRIHNAMLRLAHIDRAEHFTGNVFDEQLPDNQIASWCAPMDEARAGGFDDLPPVGRLGFLRPEHRWHLDRLRDELERAAPNVIVPLGGTALWAFIGDDQISQHRGAPCAAKYIVPGAKLVPAFHPAAVMRSWKMMPVTTLDFVKAAAEAERGPELVYPKRKLLIEPTLEDVKRHCEWCMTQPLLSVDIETGWGQIESVGLGNSEIGMCVPFLDYRQVDRCYWRTLDEELAAWMAIKQVLEGPVPKLGQNHAFYDAYWFWDKYGIKLRNFAHDTRLIHHALYPELPKDLAFMGASYTSLGPWKAMRGKKSDKRDE